jgi:chorismate synthase
MTNTIGKLFRITNWGESHGKAIGIIIDGCPSLIKINEKDIQKELDRRRPGKINFEKITSTRKELDKVEILSGIFKGKTTGTPISLIIKNKNFKTKDYENLKQTYRPGHADFTYQEKYGIRDYLGGGRSSARITAGNVAAGAIAKKVIDKLTKSKIEIIAYVKKIKDIEANIPLNKISKKDIEKSKVKCPDKNVSKKMQSLVEEVSKKGDSVGGIIECVIKNVPSGLGMPVFEKLDADLAKAMLSINATKGFEIGSGFKATEMLGSENNDQIISITGKNKMKISSKTNNAGGILGGISTGQDIIFRVAFKPTPSIAKQQKTVTTKNKKTLLKIQGRHDPCVVIRAVPIIEAMAAIVLCDHMLIQKCVK